MFYFIHTPAWIQALFPSIIWKMDEEEKAIYLSFDDGPNVNTTPKILDLLDKLKAKASFFVLGEMAIKNNDLINRIIEEGHCLAYHGKNHLDGFRSSIKDYLDNAEKPNFNSKIKLFRPPYGRIRPKALRQLKKTYQIVMWTHMPGDFDKNISSDRILKRMNRKCGSGSIIVLHENPDSVEKTLFALELFIKDWTAKGYQFKPLS